MTAPKASRVLRISKDLTFPADAVTSTMAIFGGKGMGKTNLLSVIAEEVAAVGLRFAIIDPMGACWGLRHSANGKAPGIKVLILGGRHGDIPIEPTGGAVVADLVVDEDVSVIIDISRQADGRSWGKNAKIRFVRDYCTRLFERQGEKCRPLMQIIDEAARFVPQTIRKDETDTAACMGAIAQMVEEGRNIGIGIVLVSQRSARLNKDVSELADCMVAFRTIGPNSKQAIMDWLSANVPKDHLKDLDDTLRSLPRGSALVVSPGWLEFEGVVAFRPRETFDSSATPKAGQERRAPGKGAQPDLARYQVRMAETIERAKADDPKALRQRITELEKAAKKPVAPSAAAAVDPRVIERAREQERQAVTRQYDQRLLRLEAFVKRFYSQMSGYFDKGKAILEAFDIRTIETDSGVTTQARSTVVPELSPGTQRTTPRPPITKEQRKTKTLVTRPSDGVTRPQQSILDALAWLESIGINRATRTITGFLAGASPKSSAFVNNLGALRTFGAIDYPSKGDVALTDEGREFANAPDAPATSERLHEMIYGKVTRPQAAILECLIAIYPDAMDRDSLAEGAGASPTSSAYVNNLGALRSIGLIDYPTKGEVVALPLLFLEGR